MRLPNRIYDHALRRPRALFAAGLITLCMTLVLSYERINQSAFSLLGELVPATDDLVAVPLTDQQKEEYKSLFEGLRPMSYGSASRPPMKAMPERMVDDLPEEFVPTIAAAAGARRLVIVGDVHGQKKALEDLLAKVGFDNDGGDHLVLVGDLVNKGPDSAGVVAMAMDLGAHAVRGNNEDRVLLAHADMARQDGGDKKKKKNKNKSEKPARDEVPDVDLATAALETFQIKDGASPQAAMAAYQEGEAALAKGDQGDRQTARSLSAEQIAWLADLPLVLRVGTIPRDAGGAGGLGAPGRTLENLVVCHAGLVPGVALEDQDPWAVMNMRTISHPADEQRRDAVRDYLKERAEAGGGRGALAAAQGVDDAAVDRELARIAAAAVPGSAPGEGDPALPSSGRDGTYWYEEWSRFQEKLVKKQEKAEEKRRKKQHEEHGRDEGGEDEGGQDEGASEARQKQPVTTVVYGHDAKSGLRVPKEYGKGKKGYTFGLDSGCVYGRSLTALVVEVRDGEAAYEIVQVDCDKAVDTKEDQ